MDWITFAYSLSKNQSSIRVSLWRRLQRLGAVAPAGNLYVLPAMGECVESFQWLTQEIQEAGGQAIMFHCEQIDGMTEQALIDLFCEARSKDYESILDQLIGLENEFMAQTGEDDTGIQSGIAKLRQQYTDVFRIDYFRCSEGVTLASRLTQLEQKLRGDTNVELEITPLNIRDFQGKTWVTRPQPFIDRLSSIWLIRKFIDPNAEIVYRDRVINDSEISFDMPNAQFGHTGNLCTFETLITTFQISAEGLTKVAEIVHEIDLHDGHYHHPEAVGIELILNGWLQQGLSDEALAERGLALFDGLFSAIHNQNYQQ